jgi:hypothetical protein
MNHFVRGGPPGVVTAMGLRGRRNAHLADIETLSNGFIVRFQRAQKISVKKKTIDSLGFDAETKEIVRLSLQKMKEGEQWKDMPPEAEEILRDQPSERWIMQSMALACKDETELIAAIREAVVAHGEIERLSLEGEFSSF